MPTFTAVLTRPAGQSDSLLAALAQEGIAALEFPLIDIAPVADDAPLGAALAALERYALVIFVSPNAIDRALARLKTGWPHDVPIGVVGPGSVAALARHGIAPPDQHVICPAFASATASADASSRACAAAQPEQGDTEARFDSEALFAALDAQIGIASLAGRRVLIVRGDGGREWLADRLREAGAQVEPVAAYRRVLPAPARETWDAVRRLLAGAPHAWLVTSSEGVRNLAALAEAHLSEAEQAQLKAAACVAPHPRIAETARALGFDRITTSGPGDERIVAALRALRASTRVPDHAAPRALLDQPAFAPHSAHPRMTDTNQESASPPYTPPYTQPPVYDTPRRRGGALIWLVIVAVVAAAAVGAYALNRKLDRLDGRLSARQQANDAQTAELRVKVGEALAAVHQIDTQSAQLQSKLADAQTAQQALAQQYQDLARGRDDWTMDEVEQMLSSASQQLQLTGNTQLALFALQSADTRLASSTSPQAAMVRRAIAQDIDKLKSAPSTDLTGFAIKLDEAISQVDTLPLAGEVPLPHAVSAAGAAGASHGAAAPRAGSGAVVAEAGWKRWWHSVSSAVGEQLSGLVQVRRIDNADAMLNSPEQAEFLRQNVKLRLLSARLALLSRNADTLKSDLAAADAALARYFDGASKRTLAVRDLIKQVGAGAASVTVPNLNDSLQAVHNYKSRG
jgi:uroporphyrinogen III methyltransferase/synthase